MTFSLGRKGSSEVASWWSEFVDPQENTFGHNPDELNFALDGVLRLKGHFSNKDDTWTIQNAFFGQGNSGSSNNWWFGGPLCTKISSGDQVSCYATDTSDQQWLITFSRGSDGGSGVSTVGIESIVGAN